MTFRVLARTLLHLGAELISSDIVALYELVKNAFDVDSKRVVIDVVVRVKYADIEQLAERLEESRTSVPDTLMGRGALGEFRQELLTAVDRTAPEARVLRRAIEDAADWEALADTLAAANYIEVSDTGEGMSLEKLQDVFLTIGTRSRHAALQAQQTNGDFRPVLGEKGVGRLSTMRLGKRLHVESTMAGETYWNVLDIDWSQLSHESSASLEEFAIDIRQGSQKDDPAFSGTHICIAELNAEWTVEKLTRFAREEFSKLTDPFIAKAVIPVLLRFNDEPIPIPRFAKLLLEHAHATVQARFERGPDDMMRLVGTVQYKGRQRTFALEGAHLVSPTDSSPRVLESLGPFALEMYWYNRRVLAAMEGIGDRSEVLGLVNAWGGGVMVFRDGFRVLPYGGPDDDWLGLDRRAFSSGGYKVHRS